MKYTNYCLNTLAIGALACSLQTIGEDKKVTPPPSFKESIRKLDFPENNDLTSKLQHA